MAGEAVVKFTDANFEQEVLKSDVPVLVDFWAEWCAPCRMLAPTIDAVAEEFQGKVKVGKVDTEANRGTAAKYDIRLIPTIILFNKGEAVKTITGMTPKKDLVAELESLVGEGGGVV